MRITAAVLRRFVEIPDDTATLRRLLDDLGLEVKRAEGQGSDAAFTLELLANRGDHHAYAGLAREIGGRTGASVRLPPVAELRVGASPIEVRVETPLCLVYTATLLERTGPPESLDPDELAPIVGAGQSPVSAPVDATNLANLELGQPTHAFDADRIDGRIVVRVSRAGERAWPLFFAEPIEVPEGTLVIADDAKILAIAGVIGCEEAKTTEDTRRVLLESATFDPVSVRKARRALGVSTDSSARFERGADPTAPLVGAGRVVWLLERHGWRRVGDTGRFGDWTDPGRVIAVDTDALRRFLDVPTDDDEIAARLARYGFGVARPGAAKLAVRVPPHRLWDVEFDADIAEEIAKSLGYNATPATLPPVDMGALPTPADVVRARADDVLVGFGFYEVFTDGFYGRDVRDKLALDERHPLWAHVETENAVDRAYSLLKNNALAQLVDAVAVNLRLQTRRIKAYEWTRTFHPDATADNGVCRERRVLCAIACGPERAPSWRDDVPDADVFFLMGVVRELGHALGLPLTTRRDVAAGAIASLLHPGRQAAVTIGDRVVGVVGEVHPKVLANWRVKRERPVYLELDVAALEQPGERPVYVEPPEQQTVERNLAFTLPGKVEAGDIAAHLRAQAVPWLRGVDIVDLFEHAGDDGAALRTVTYALYFRSDGPPITTDALNAAADTLIGSVQAAFGDRGVRLR